MKWPEVKLGTLTAITTGKLDANAADENGTYPFFTCAVAPSRINKYAFDCEAVLIAGNGDLNVKYYDGKFNAYQRTYVVQVVDKEQLDVRFLFHFLNLYVVKLRQMAIGGVIKYIKLPYLTDAVISLPPLAEQKRIAEQLDTADRILRLREASIAKLDQLAQSVFVECMQRVSTNESLLEDVAEMYQPKTISSNDLVEDGKYVVFGANGIIGRYDQYNHEEPEVLVTCRGATCGTINRSEPYSWVTGNAMVVRPLDDSLITKDYLFGYFKYVADFSAVITGAAQPQITRQSLSRLSIKVPNIDSQRLVAERLSHIEETKKSHLHALRHSNFLLQSLQHRSFAVN